MVFGTKGFLKKRCQLNKVYVKDAVPKDFKFIDSNGVKGKMKQLNEQIT